MTFDMGSIMTLVLETIRNPKAGADAILARRIERGVLWQLLALVTVLSVLAAQITVVLLGPGSGELMGGPLLNSPLLATVIQAALLLALVYATFAIGRAFGGHGTFDDVLALVIWLQFILLVIQMIQTFALMVFPVLGILIALASIVLFIWLLVNFVAHVHGFQSLPHVLVGILVSAFAIIFLFTLLLAMLGIAVPVSQ